MADLTLPTLKDPCPGHLGIQGMMGNVVLAASPRSALGSPLGGVAVSAVAACMALCVSVLSASSSFLPQTIHRHISGHVNGVSCGGLVTSPVVLEYTLALCQCLGY